MTNEKDLPENDPLEIVAIAGPAEAQMIGEMLRNNGIESTLQGDVVSTLRPRTVGVRPLDLRGAAAIGVGGHDERFGIFAGRDGQPQILADTDPGLRCGSAQGERRSAVG